MATQKKSKRGKKRRSSANPRNYSSLYKDDRSSVPSETPAVTETEVEAAAAPVGGKGSDTVDWQGDYNYVVKDLRQLAIVSVVLFAVIIGIGLFI
jgi:hypothetical protein